MNQGAHMSKVEPHSWTFLTNHGHVVLCLAADPTTTVRELALRVGITERAALRIIGELEDGGVLTRTREGRRNRYTLHEHAPLRHELERHCRVGDLIDMVVKHGRDQPT
jgi:DNA-binding Lrp family transcriptional regulator